MSIRRILDPTSKHFPRSSASYRGPLRRLMSPTLRLSRATSARRGCKEYGGRAQTCSSSCNTREHPCFEECSRSCSQADRAPRLASRCVASTWAHFLQRRSASCGCCCVWRGLSATPTRNSSAQRRHSQVAGLPPNLQIVVQHQRTLPALNEQARETDSYATPDVDALPLRIL